MMIKIGYFTLFVWICTVSYQLNGQSTNRVGFELSNSKVFPLQSNKINNTWLSNREIRNHGFPVGSTIVYSPFYYYPGFTLDLKHISKRQFGLCLELGYQKFGFAVGRMGFDTTAEYPRTSVPREYFTTLPYWQDLNIHQWRIGFFGSYYYEFDASAVTLSVQAGAYVAQNIAEPTSTSPFINISDTSRFYTYALGINSYRVGTSIVPSVKLSIGQFTKRRNELALRFSFTYLNMSQIIRPVVVEYYNGRFQQTELQIPSLVICNIGLSYTYNLSNLTTKNKN